MCPLSEYLKQMSAILPDYGELDITALEEGFSNKVYRISWHHSPRLVVRVPLLNEEVFAIDRGTERRVWKMAAQQNLSPALRWHNALGVTASEFMLANTFPWDVSHTDAALRSIVRVVRQVHQLPALDWHYDVFNIMRNWLEQMVRYDGFDKVRDDWERLNACFETLQPPQRPSVLVLSHNDLNPKNMLSDGEQVWLIDWECAGMNDPLFDLAVLTHAHHLDHEQQQLCAQALLQNALSEDERGWLEQYRKAYVLRELIWLLLKHLQTPQDLTSLECYHSLLIDPVFNPYFNESDYESCT